MCIAMVVTLGAGGQVGQGLYGLLIASQTAVRVLTRLDCDIGDVASLERHIAGGALL